LYRKEIEGKTGLESIQIQNQSVIEFAANDRRSGLGFFIMGFAKTLDKLRICYQIKTDFIFLTLSRDRDREHFPHYGHNQSEDDGAQPQVFEVLRERIVSHWILHSLIK
jgi:hypothetical protein